MNTWTLKEPWKAYLMVISQFLRELDSSDLLADLDKRVPCQHPSVGLVGERAFRVQHSIVDTRIVRYNDFLLHCRFSGGLFELAPDDAVGRLGEVDNGYDGLELPAIQSEWRAMFQLPLLDIRIVTERLRWNR